MQLTMSVLVKLCMWLTAVAVVAAAPSHHRSSTTPQAVIVNGTQVSIGYTTEAFVFCMAQVEPSHQLHQYQVQWRSSTKLVQSWSQDNRNAFSLGGGSHLPHKYLVFHYFSNTYAGDYTCVLLDDDGLILSSSVVTIQSS